MKKIIAVMLATVFITVTFAQTAPQTSGGGGGTSVLPISSQDELRNYALARVVKGSISLSSPSMDYSYNGLIYKEVDGLYAEDVLSKLIQTEFVFRLKNPDDVITGYLYLRDGNNGYCMFYGQAQFKVGEKPNYSIWMQSIPLLRGVQSAEILALNPDGTSSANRQELAVTSNGQLLFSPWMAGAPNGLLSVRFTDRLVIYPLAAPKAEAVGSSSVNLAGYQIEGHYQFRNPETVKITEVWQRPTVFLEIPVTNGNPEITFDVMGLVQNVQEVVFERPTAMIVSLVNGSEWSPIPFSGEEPTIIKLMPANYRIRFIWNKFGRPGMLYTGPSGGGKG